MIVSNNPAYVNVTTSDMFWNSRLPVIRTGKSVKAGPPSPDRKFNEETQVKYKAKFGGKCKYCGVFLRKNSWIYCNKDGPSPTRWCCTPRCTHLLVLDPQKMYV